MKDLLVSVIVPTKNSSRTLAACLNSIKNQTYQNIEIIVVDNKSTDKTKKIAKKFTSIVLNKGPERSAQRNLGAKKAKGRFLLFIDSDMVLSRNVVKDCVNKILKSKSTKAIIIPEESFGQGFWAQCKKLERQFYISVDWMEGARFFEAKSFHHLKGFDEKQTGTEDYDLPQRIENEYGRKSVRRIKSFIFHDEGKFSLLNSVKKKFYYAKTVNNYRKIEANSTNFKKQSNIVERYKLYFRSPRDLFRNPAYGAGMIFMKTCEFTAGGLGFLLKK